MTTPKVTRRASRRPAATSAWTASEPSAAWRAATLRACRRCSPPMRARRNCRREGISRVSSNTMMSQPIAYALVAMGCYGVCDFIYKQAATAGIRADHFLMVQACFFCSLVVLYALATSTIVLEPVALWGMLAGVLRFVGLYYFIRSLAAGAVSTN